MRGKGEGEGEGEGAGEEWLRRKGINRVQPECSTHTRYDNIHSHVVLVEQKVEISLSTNIGNPGIVRLDEPIHLPPCGVRSVDCPTTIK